MVLPGQGPGHTNIKSSLLQRDRKRAINSADPEDSSTHSSSLNSHCSSCPARCSPPPRKQADVPRCMCQHAPSRNVFSCRYQLAVSRNISRGNKPCQAHKMGSKCARAEVIFSLALTQIRLCICLPPRREKQVFFPPCTDCHEVTHNLCLLNSVHSVSGVYWPF